MRFERERKKMVEEQIIKRGISNKRVVEAMLRVPRHKFVEEALQEKAYGDYPLPIGYGQTISQPYMVALMTQCLELRGTERVLEVGTGSGYQAAILGELAEKVFSIERVKELALRSRRILEELNYKNVLILNRDGSCGLPEFSPYQGIIVTAAAPEVPEPMIEQLADGGRLVIPKGNRFTQTLLVIEKKGNTLLTTEAGECVFVPLIGKYGWEDDGYTSRLNSHFT